MSDELKIQKDIDIKFTRLLKPILNNIDLPLSGIYNNRNNIEFPNFPLKKKFKNFGICPPEHLGIENLFQLNTSFGRPLIEEKMEGLIILTNISSRDFTIINLEISFNCDEKKASKDKNNEKYNKLLSIHLPDSNNSLFLSPNQSYYIKIQNYIKYSGKYTINVSFRVKSLFYTQQYNLLKQKEKLKKNPKDYIINKDNQIELLFYKKFNFNAYCPFHIKEVFRLNQMKEEYFIEINIKNQSMSILTLLDLIIMPKKRNKNILKPIINLQEIQDNENDPSLGGYENNTKILSLQPDEELNLFFISDSSDIFLNEESFILYIKWLNIFDFSPKTFEYEFKNGLNIFNKYFIFNIAERPMGKIIQNSDFPIVFQFTTKQPNQPLSLVISEYKTNGNENIENKDDNNNNEENKNKIIKDDNEIKIEIKEYKIEINEHSPRANVNIICKSDKLGFVSFPKISITLYAIEYDKEEKIEEYIYKDILCFNCVQNVQLI